LGLQIPQARRRVRRRANISLENGLVSVTGGTVPLPDHSAARAGRGGEFVMRSVLLWLIGIPIPIILLLALCTHHF
jgi:hypothetical protein